MDQYLLQILKETNTIIIPDLGALTITNATTGEIMFMPFLKHDDGKLSAHIAAKEGIEENEAKNIVAKHVREIKSSVDKGDSYDMFEFGTFTKGDDGDVEFTNWVGESTKASDKESTDDSPKTATPPVVAESSKTEDPNKQVKETPEKESKRAKEEKPKAEIKPKATAAKPKAEIKKAPAKKTAAKKAPAKKAPAKKKD